MVWKFLLAILFYALASCAMMLLGSQLSGSPHREFDFLPNEDGLRVLIGVVSLVTGICAGSIALAKAFFHDDI